MMQFLLATRDIQGLHFSVWLDTSKGTQAEPNQSYVRNYDWQPQPDGWTGATLNGTDYATWSDYCVAETKILAQLDLDVINAPQPAPTDLSVSGQTF